jgi:muramoyltetrapeptide carboxypeptidase
MKLGIVSPSAPSTHTEKRKEQYKQGLETIATLNIETIISEHAEDAMSYISSTQEQRLSDLHKMYSSDVDYLIAANGGWNSSHLLQNLDFDLIKKAHKPLIGFSDISVLLNAIYKKTGLIQYHGPMVTWGFFENNEVTNKSFIEALTTGSQQFSLNSFGEFWRGESISGVLVGGNLVSLRNLIGTPYEPDWEGKIIFWEETEETLFRLDRELTHYKNAGIWNKISGMLIGHLDQIDEEFAGKKSDTKEMIMNHFEKYNFPILKTDLFGHTTPTNITIPVGGKIELNDTGIIISSK